MHIGQHHFEATAGALLPIDHSGNAALATHVAIASGAWSNPATWRGGEVPSTGAIVHIPAGHTITIDDDGAPPIFLIRVDGGLVLSAEDGQTSRLQVDTIIGSPGSSLMIDADAPGAGSVDLVFSEVAPAAHSEVFADRSSGDGVLGRSDWDPDQLSLGLVTAGSVDIAGRDVDAGLRLAVGARTGDDALLLDVGAARAGTGWAVGQTIVVGGTQYLARNDDLSLQTEDEVRQITSLHRDGDRLVVTLDRPLEHDHLAPADPETGQSMPVFVGNLSRNVTISSEAALGAGDPSPGRAATLGDVSTPGDHLATERGHVMLMQTENVAISNAAFVGLGRTDKSVPVDDLRTGGVTNQRLHQDGGAARVFEPDQDLVLETPADQITNHRGRYALHLHEAGTVDGVEAAEISGNVIWGSPGWGLVQHSSFANVTGNLAFDVAGAAFVAESGNELGRWRDNLAIGTFGARDRNPNQDSADANEDDGASGTAFYLKSRAIEVVDNAAHSSARAGFFYHTVGVDVRDTPVAGTPWLEDLANGLDTLATERVPIRSFTGNHVIAAREGLRIVTDPHDSVRKFSDAYSVMSDFSAYQIDLAGVMVTYSSKYVFEDFTLLGTEDRVTGYAPGGSGGFLFGASAADMTVVDSHTAGFDFGVLNWSQVGDRQERLRGYWDPKDPTSDLRDAPAYTGLGTVDGIENPAHNLWNTNILGLTHADLARAPVRLPGIEVPTGSGETDIFQGGVVWDPSEDVSPGIEIDIELLDDSRDGGLVALWREGIADDPDQAAMLARHIPLSYGSHVHLDRIDYAGAPPLLRGDFTKYAPGINADIWSGTVLEFAKTDSLGRQVYRYADFAPLDWDGATRAVTTNERIVFSREMIDATLIRDGFVRAAEVPDMRFVVMSMVFSDRLTGMMETRGIVIALDQAWQLPVGTRDAGLLAMEAGMIVAPVYRPFSNGIPVEGASPITLNVPTDDDSGDSLPGTIGTDAADILNMGNGDDTVDARGGNDVVRGYDGADVLLGGDGRDRLIGHAGDDHLIGGDDGDVLQGGAGADRLEGGGGADKLAGGDGDDLIIGGAGADALIGGAGVDRADYRGAGPGLVVDLKFAFAMTGDAAGDVLTDVEEVAGSAGSDRLAGGDGADRLFGMKGPDLLFGRNGNDLLDGGDGDDLLNGGAGADTLDGGAGRDRAQYNNAVEGVVADLNFSQSNRGEAEGDRYVSIEDIHGSALTDRLWGDDLANELLGGAGNDILGGRSGDDTLDGGDGHDLLTGGPGADLLIGGPGQDRAQYRWAEAGVTVDLSDPTRNTGEATGDRFVSIERIYGSAHADRLAGDAENNVFWGAGGRDVFEFADGAGSDWIMDLGAGGVSDYIDLSGATAIVDFADLMANHASQSGTHVLIESGEDRLVLARTDLADLETSAFLF